jgi:transcriptional regulator with GAF, ATPase, and Fis domain
LVCYFKRPALDATASHAGVGAAAPVLIDSAMLRIYALLERVAAGELPVLLLGETGVGKEVAAKWVHARSTRAHAPFLALNCAAFSPSLLESELFGHEKGAFTGANSTKVGLLEAADRGTLFLDEVGEMPAGVQAAFLRVLEERAVLRVGATRARPIDVRIVAATNRSLEAEVAAGRFRKDLYFRLNGISVELPPLRARPSEILPLALALLHQRARSPGVFTARAEAAMLAYAWPGNVRELRNVVERAALLAGDARVPIEIDVEHLGLPAEPPAADARAPRSSEPPRLSRRTLPPSRESASAGPSPRALRDQLESLERERIVQALEAHGGNQTRAAAALGMPRRTFVARLDVYGIARPRRR